MFEKAKSDVLLLLDCCSAASAAPIAGRAIIETIAACGWESIAPEPGRFSFTDTLIRVLEEWISKPFTAAMLHSEILSRLKHKRPERVGSQRIERRRTPIYIVTTADIKACSIQLSKLIIPSVSELGVVLDGAPKIEGGNASSPKPSKDVQGLADVEPGRTLETPHVLISVALEENQILDGEACGQWLSTFPALAKFAKVQSVFKSYSTLLLVSLPVMVWDLLPENSACSFVGYVSSNDLLKGTSSSNTSVSNICKLLDPKQALVKLEQQDDTTPKRKYRRHPEPDMIAPEIPPSAYVIFSNALREDLKNQGLSLAGLAKIVGYRW